MQSDVTGSPQWQWNVTYSTVDNLLDIEFIVEKDTLAKRWFFNLRYGGSPVIAYRSNAEWDTPEEATKAAQTWYEQSEFKVQRTIAKEWMALEWVASHAPNQMAVDEGYTSPFVRKLVEQGDVKEYKYPDKGFNSYEITGQGILRLAIDQCPHCRKQLYGEKEHSWCIREHEARAAR